MCVCVYENKGLTWHLISMLKKSSLGSWRSPSPTRCPRLFWVILRPGRLPTLTRWSSRRRLWELAIRSNSSSVWGEVVMAGSRRKKKKTKLINHPTRSEGNRKTVSITDQSCHLGTAWSLRHLRRFAARQDGSAGHPYGCSGTYWAGRRSSLHRRGPGPASARWMANAKQWSVCFTLTSNSNFNFILNAE